MSAVDLEPVHQPNYEEKAKAYAELARARAAGVPRPPEETRAQRATREREYGVAPSDSGPTPAAFYCDD